MKYLALAGLLTLTFACGGSAEQPPPLAEGDRPSVEDPGTVSAQDGVAIAYTVSGRGSPVLLFIHGWMCDQTFWSAQVDTFSASNTVVTVDLPGHGLSGVGRETWSVLAFGADVQTVIEHLDLKDVVLIGHSMGGPVALEAARLMPERVIGVVAVDSLQDAETKYDPEQFENMLAAFEHDFVGTCNQFSLSMFSEDSDPRVVEQVTNAMCDGSPDIGTALTRDFVDYDLGPALAAVNVPVRFLNSDMWTTNVEANRRYQPNFDGVVIEGVGHFLMMEQPEAFNEQLRKVLATLDRPPQ
jgi:pimeloyl-ACP methyl ester carboxylesterase